MDMYLLVVLQLFMPIPKDLLVLKDLVRRFGVHFFADLIDCLAAILLARLDKLGKVTAVPCLKPGLEELVLLGNLLLTQWHCCCDFLLLNLAVCFVFVCPHFLTLVLWHLTREEKKTQEGRRLTSGRKGLKVVTLDVHTRGAREMLDITRTL
jgi:hypothetical protein